MTNHDPQETNMITRLTLVAIAPLSIALLVGAGPAGADDAGQQAFADAKCNMCHSIQAKGIEATVKVAAMQGPDLSTTGASHSAEWIVKFVNKEEKMDDKEHTPKYAGTKEQLDAAAAWLAGLK
jgi:cbb3-type cytochrome oxidase cytochrome c subunit